MAEAISSFRGVAHRLEPVREFAGVTWVNDSIATAPERVLAALRSYDAPLILLAGGKDKQLPWEDMLRLALQKTAASSPSATSASRSRRKPGASGGKDAPVFCVPGLMRRSAWRRKRPRRATWCCCRQAARVYDAYRDFAERGAHFRQLVQGL